jgi:hypothetical protein
VLIRPNHSCVSLWSLKVSPPAQLRSIVLICQDIFEDDILKP